MKARTLVLLLLALSLLTGCVSLPTSGEVRTEPEPEPVTEGAGSFDYTPSGPRPGASALEIVQDFLLAMEASPQSTAVARQFLSEKGRAGWSPDEATVVYGSRVISGDAPGFRVSLEDTVQLDDRGTWVGAVNGDRGLEHRLRLTREQGEWRITNPPDALVVSRQHFETRYQQFFLYYFDPTARVLVPEPTYLPHGEQAATILVRRLLRGPRAGLDGVVRTFLPSDGEHPLSVPVSQRGVAEVELGDDLLRLNQEHEQLALAQLAWTLRQVAGVESMRVTVDGVPLEIPGPRSTVRVASWAQFDPSIHWASQELFGLRKGEVVVVPPDGEELVGRFGTGGQPLREISVELGGERLAAVTEDGTTVLLTVRGREQDSPAEVVATGTDLARPAWDLFGGMWLLDRTASGPQLRVVTEDGATPVPAPGLEGKDVSAFTVSRDGSRLVAVVRAPRGDHLVISRVLRSAAGEVQGLTRAEQLPLAQGGVDEIRDLAWRTPASLAVLTGPTPGSSQVLLALVDGSVSLGEDEGTPEMFRRRARDVVAAPSPETTVHLGTPDGGLFELLGDGQWAEVTLEGPLLAPTFVG